MSIFTAQTPAETTRSTFYSMTRRGGTLIVRFMTQRLGESQATVICPDIREEIDAMGSTFQSLVLDLSQVRVMSSYGLGLCIELRNHAHAHNGTTTLVGMCLDIRELFRIMRVERLFTVVIGR